MLMGGSDIPDLEFIRGLYQRENRDKAGLFLVEGIRFLVSAINVDAEILFLILCPELEIGSFAQRLITRKKEKGISVLYVNASQFRSISSIPENCRAHFFISTFILPVINISVVQSTRILNSIIW